MAVLYLDPFTAVYCCRAVVSEDAKNTLASSLQTSPLDRKSNTVSGCVRPWIKITPEFPFKSYFLKTSQITEVAKEWDMSFISHIAQETISNIFNFSLSLAAKKVFMLHRPEH